MDRRLAATNPNAADKHAMEKLGDAMMSPPAPPIEQLGPRTGARESLLGIAGDLRAEVDSEAAKRDEFARRIFEDV